MHESILEQIESNSVLKRYIGIFRSLYGFDIHICRLDGTPYLATAQQDSAEKQTHHQNKLLTRVLELQKNPTESRCCIKKEILDNIKEQTEPQTYFNRAGQRRIVVPICYRGEPVGIICVQENGGPKLSAYESEKVKDLLLQFTSYVLKNELNPLNGKLYRRNNLTHHNSILHRVVHYIKCHFYTDKVTLKEVATHAGVSYHHLSRIFKKELRISFAQFRNKVRLEAAINMLSNISLSVSQIAYACGYNEPAYFIKVFRNSYGMTPLQYRAKKLGRLKKGPKARKRK